MAETYMKKEDNYREAIRLFESIDEKHPDYIFAQHSKAVCHAILGDIDGATQALLNCIYARATTPVQHEAVNRSYLLLGYIYYEERTLGKAVAALRKVPQSSYYYEDACLGLGWCAVRAQQWADCIAMGRALEKAASSDVLRCEAAVLQAVGYYKNEQYPEALQELERVGEVLRDLRPPVADTLTQRTIKNKTNRVLYNFVARKVMDICYTPQSVQVNATIDSLHTEQMKQKEKLDAYVAFTDSFTRRLYFARSIDMIRSDIEYFMARLKLTVEQSGVGEMKQKLQKKQEKLDREIEELEKEMESLE
jgi:tetratricopeptide (TPR) repeat protein